MSTKWKAAIAVILCVVIALAIGGRTLWSGTVGRAAGYSGTVEVSGEKQDDGTFKLTLEKQSEGYGIGDIACLQIVDTINEKQNLDVDILSGATASSSAAIKASTKVLESLGYDIAALTPTKSDQLTTDYIEEKCDVVVVGASASGIMAAISATQNGAQVIVVEQTGIAGGNSLFSGGLIMAANTELQVYNGIMDSSASMAGSLYQNAGENVKQNRLVRMAENSAENLRMLLDLGVKTSDALLKMDSDITPRVHVIVDDKGNAGGGALIKPLYFAAKELGVKFVFDSEVYETVRDSYSNVIGVKAKQANGDILTVWADATIIASGGYDRNDVLIRNYNDSYVLPTYSYSASTNTGNGIKIAENAGAQIYRGSLIAELHDFYANTNGSNGLIITPLGIRFADESKDAFYLGGILQREGYGKAYLILDSSSATKEVRAAVESGHVYQADTLDELAEQIDARGLAQSVSRYNKILTSGEDTDFGKDISYFKAIEKGPFYAVEYSLQSYGTMGGIQTNTAGQAQSLFAVIPGLYACGEASNGAYFDGVFPGFAAYLTQEIETGKITGEKAAAYALEQQIPSEIDFEPLEQKPKSKY